MPSYREQAKRALVSLLKSLSITHKVNVKFARESSDSDVCKAYRAVMKKLCAAEHSNLKESFDKWQCFVKSAPGSGNGKKTEHVEITSQMSQVAPSSEDQSSSFRIRSIGVLLTYQKVSGLDQWHRFTMFVQARLGQWKVKYWTATLETNADGTYHAHLMLQFTSQKDCTVAIFAFEGLRPNAGCTDYLGEGQCRKKLQQSLDRGFFYVWADKEGLCKQSCNDPL